MPCRGCGGQTRPIEELVEPPDSPVQPQGELVPLVREYCPRCTFKHLAYAYVALQEAENGYPEHIQLANNYLLQAGFAPDATAANVGKMLDAKAKAVGHLVHAMEECPDAWLAKKIRRAYVALLDDEAVEIFPLIQKLMDDATTS